MPTIDERESAMAVSASNGAITHGLHMPPSPPSISSCTSFRRLLHRSIFEEPLLDYDGSFLLFFILQQLSTSLFIDLRV